MPGCAAIGCNNRSEKGYSMKCFPRDTQLRQVWKERVGRANWEPSKNSFLCHDHFEPDQYVKTEHGRMRLKRDAIPSIFKETSTRKSPSKRRLQNSNASSNTIDNTVHVTAVKLLDDESEDNNYTLEYLDDCEYEATTQINDGKSNILFNHLTKIKSVDMEQGSVADRKKNYELAYHIVSEKDMKGLEKENVIIVSDENNREIGRLVHNNESVIIVADENNKEIGQIIVENNLLGQCHLNADLKRQNSYDEIEEKLKQICNGEDVTVSITPPKNWEGSSFAAGKETNVKKEPATRREDIADTVIWTTNPKLRRDIPENVKLIFGDESGLENIHTSDTNAQERKRFVGNHQAAKNTAREDESIRFNVGSLKESLPKGDTSDAPNVKAAMKRQRRTRDDVMRSIESAIAELSEKTLRSIQNDQLSRSVLRIARTRRKRDRKKGNAVSCARKKPLEIIEDTFELDDCDSSTKKSKFTIKVTGVAKDVSEIIEGLGTTSGHTTVQINNNTIKNRNEKNKGGNFAPNYNETDVRDLRRFGSRFNDAQELSVESSQSDEEFSSDFDSESSADDCKIEEAIHNQNRKSNKSRSVNVKQAPSDIETLFKRNKEFIHTEEFDTKMQMKNLLTEQSRGSKIEHPDSNDDNNQSMRFKYFSKSQNTSRELQQKITTQQEVIGKLTNQLIIYKGLEAKLASLNFQLEIKTKEIQVLKDKLQDKLPTPTRDVPDSKKDTDIKQQTISNLSNRVNRLKEANKKLMQQIASESQNRKLGYHLKQKDDQIKELNWKLEKASKFLDRAEKNANTYKRKMVNMQTSIRRQKALEEKRNHFQELLIDNAKHEFSESALLTAMDIKNSCGIKCYQKLLSYNFPLPSLRTLRRRFQKENVTEDDWGEEDQELVVDSEDKNNVAIKEICQSNELGETEITGTVQDIFEENNDAEELNSSELGEHIFSQFENERKYADT